MIRLPIFALATAALPAALSAQTVNPPVAWEDTPNVQLKLPGAAVTAAAVQAPVAMLPRPAPVVVAPPPARIVDAPRPAPVAVAPRPAPVVAAFRPTPRMAPPMAAAAPPPDPIMRTPPPRMVQARLNRGQRVDGVWGGPRVQIRNYDAYGLYPPATGNRWIRYYDDALLVDGGGTVRDGRYGLDWDQYGDDWADEGGVPVYVGDGGYVPGAADYAYVEDYARGADRAYANNERYRDWDAPERERHLYRGADAEPGVTYSCRVIGGPPGPCGPDRGGWGYPPGTMITETIVTTPPVTTARTYYVERVVAAAPLRAKTKRLYRRKPDCNCQAPAPIPYGEKG